MKIDKNFLRSKVARRIFLLFISCAMLPIAILALVSSGFVTHRLDEQSRERLRRQTKSLAMELMGRLTLVDSELQMLARVAGSDPEFRGYSDWHRLSDHLEDHFDEIAFVAASGNEHQLPDSGPPTGRGARASRLSISRTDGATGVRLITPVDGENVEPGYISASVQPDYLWNFELPPDAELLILDHDGTVVHGTLPTGVGPGPEAARSIGRTRRGDFDWAHAGQEYLAHHWLLYLKPQFGHSGWTIVLSETRQPVVGMVDTVGRILPLVILLCLSVVVLLSLVLIRKSLVPIVSLKEGTRRIAESQFDTRVSVTSGDEFQALAESFNAMASRLGSQFQKLNALADIDRAILSTLEEAQIVGTVLTRMPVHLPCDTLAVMLVDGDQTGEVRIRARRLSEAGPEINESIVLPPEDHPVLPVRSDEAIRVPADAIPPHLAAVFPETTIECLVLPFTRSGVVGWIVLGDETVRVRSDEDLTEARRLADQVAVALSNARLLTRVEQVNWETLHALARAVDANSPWTAGHSERVTAMSLTLGRRLGLSEDELIVLHKGGLLHDIGKIGVPSQILDKPGKLTPEEMALMRDHVVIGARILEPISAYGPQIPIVLYHHERYDGRGYPEGLTGEEIPYLARILSVADVYDALISDRPYRAPWSRERVIAFIAEGAGELFDPRVVSVFLDLMRNAPAPIKEEARPQFAVPV